MTYNVFSGTLKPTHFTSLGRQEGQFWPVKNGMVEVALVSPDGVAPSQMVDVSAFVDLPLHSKVQKFSSGTGSPGWSRKKGRKPDVCVCYKSTFACRTDGCVVQR